MPVGWDISKRKWAPASDANISVGFGKEGSGVINADGGFRHVGLIQLFWEASAVDACAFTGCEGKVRRRPADP